MFRNKLTKWKAVAFRNLENRTFAARPFCTLNMTNITSSSAKTILSSSKVKKSQIYLNLISLTIYRLGALQNCLLELKAKSLRDIHVCIQRHRVHQINYDVFYVFFFRITTS